METAPAAMKDSTNRPDTLIEDSMISPSDSEEALLEESSKQQEEKNAPTPEASSPSLKPSTREEASDEQEFFEHQGGAHVDLRDTDVICARGFSFKRHPGNMRYRALLSAYLQKDEEQYDLYSRIIVSSILEKKARYVKQDKKRGGWIVIGYTEACRKTYKALKHSKQKRAGDEVENERKKESAILRAEAAARQANAVKKKEVPKPPTQEYIVDCDVLFTTTSSEEIENRPGNMFFQRVLNIYRDVYKSDPRPAVGEQLVGEIMHAFKASGKRFMVSVPNTLGAKNDCYVEMQESETKTIMADAIAASPPAAGTSSASTQGEDQHRFMLQLYSAGLANTFLPGVVRQSAARGLEAFMDYHSPPAAGLSLLPPSVDLGYNVGRTNLLGNDQDTNMMPPPPMLAAGRPKYQQGMPPNDVPTQSVPVALTLVQYVLKNWQEKLRDSYQDIPETSIPRNAMFPHPKRGRASKKKENKNKKQRRQRSNENSSQDEHHDSSGSSDEEEGPENYTPEPTGTVVSFDDGLKWKVERVGNVNILSPYTK